MGPAGEGSKPFPEQIKCAAKSLGDQRVGLCVTKIYLPPAALKT